MALARTSLKATTMVAAAILGILAVAAGTGLVLAALTTPQPASQLLTAAVFLAVGLVNIGCAFALGRERPRAILSGALATTTLLIYLLAGLRDFGELFWAHVVYLLLLIALRVETRARTRIAT